MWLPYCRHHHHEPVEAAAALEARGLSVSYAGARGPAIADVSCAVPAGARVALVGANGSGKSTLLKTVAGLLAASAGSIQTFGLPLGSCHHRIAYLPQRTDLDWRFPISARRLVMTGRYVHLGWLKRPGALDWARVDEALLRLGVADLGERQIGQLSGGQQQRVLLARALAQEADLFLLDEPLNAVDAETRAVVADVLAGLQRDGKTAIVATHDLGRLETEFDYAIFLSEGRVTAPPPGSLLAHAQAAEALGGLAN